MNKRKLKKLAKKKGLPMPFVGSANKKKYFKTLGQFPLVKKLTGGQAKLDKNKNNKIDAEDFKILRGGKKPMKAALGAIALGLGAKKMKDKGKMMPLGIGATAMKAKKMREILGKKKGGELKKDPTKPVNPFEKRRKMLGGAGSAIGRAAKAGLKFGVAGAALGAAGAGAAMLGRKIGKKLDERKARKRDEAKVQKKMGGGMMKKYSKGGGADTGKQGERKSKRMVLLDKFLGPSKRGRDTDEKVYRRELFKSTAGKKINAIKGGGMMNKPMGYKSGASVMARGCKLGRKKPTKMY